MPTCAVAQQQVFRFNILWEFNTCCRCVMNCQMSCGDIGVSLIKFLVYYYSLYSIQRVASLIYMHCVCRDKYVRIENGYDVELYYFFRLDDVSDDDDTVKKAIQAHTNENHSIRSFRSIKSGRWYHNACTLCNNSKTRQLFHWTVSIKR